jgi:hypothetical protein
MTRMISKSKLNAFQFAANRQETTRRAGGSVTIQAFGQDVGQPVDHLQGGPCESREALHGPSQESVWLNLA